MLYRISSNYFVAGYDIETGNIAPIIRYMQGWSLERIKEYCQKKGWILEVIKN